MLVDLGPPAREVTAVHPALGALLYEQVRVDRVQIRWHEHDLGGHGEREDRLDDPGLGHDDWDSVNQRELDVRWLLLEDQHLGSRQLGLAATGEDCQFERRVQLERQLRIGEVAARDELLAREARVWRRRWSRRSARTPASSSKCLVCSS